MMTKTKARTLALSAPSPQRTNYLLALFAILALAFAWLALPQFAHAQGIVRGAQEGAYDGNRAAGPVGGAVGTVVGGAVGGAVGAVDGILGVPHRRWHHGCHGFHDRYGHFHCYR